MALIQNESFLIVANGPGDVGLMIVDIRNLNHPAMYSWEKTFEINKDLLVRNDE